MPARASLAAASPVARAATPAAGARRRMRTAGTERPRRHSVPTFGADLVSRPALVQRLSARQDAWLALVAAPAGYGKTTLLAEWAVRDERPFAWVTLDEHDDDPVPLATAIVDAVRHSGAARSSVAAVAAALTADGTPPASLPARLTPATRTGDRAASFVLVLDDVHHIRPRLLARVVGALHRQLPEGVQVALASRGASALPVARLRASRALVEVQAEDLAMTATESAKLLTRAGLALERSVVERLVERTEGWPVALYLAALSLRAAPDPAAAAARYTGDDPLVAEYVRDELLSGLSGDERHFLTRASVIDEPGALACDAVLGRDDSAAVLAGLVARKLLVALGPNAEGCRWPVLLRDMLDADLHRSSPALAASLHDRASAWYEQRGDIEGAIEHAVRGRDVSRTGQLLWANVLRYVTRGGHETLTCWLAAFSEEQIGQSAPLSLTAAYSHLMRGDIGLAHHWSLASAGAVRRGGAAVAAPSLHAGIAIVDAVSARDGVEHMGAEARRAYGLEPDDSPWRGVCCLLAGNADYLLGDRAAARGRLLEGAHRSEVAAPLVGALCLSLTAMIAIDAEDWEDAEEMSAASGRTIDANGLGQCPALALSVAVAAAVEAHAGRVDDAHESLRRASDLLARLGDFIPWYGAQTRILLARAALGLTDVATAATLLAEASRMARRTPGAVIFEGWLNDAWDRIDDRAETAFGGPLGTSSLTTAELRILRFLPTHLSLREIAKRLHVSSNTVKTQAHAVYRKLDASSRSEAVANATAAGLLGEAGPLARAL